MTQPVLTQVCTDGLFLTVEEFGKGDGVPVIFAHGLADSRALSRIELAPLADRYRVVIFDQRGHGESTPVTDPQLYDPRRMAADIGAIMDALGIDRAVVGGDSMGAATSLVFALTCPERVKALIQGVPALSDQPHQERQWSRNFGTAILEQGIEATTAALEPVLREGGMTQEGSALLCSILRTHNAQSIGLACQTVLDWVILKDLDELRHLQIPVHIVAVQHNALHPIELAARMMTALPKARMEVLPSINIFYDDPARVGCIYRDFIDSVIA
jgi:pimeloyl-ACP methyl ester carboxylesterase